MQVEFKFLADEVFLPEDDGDVSIPENKEVFSLALVEGLPHLLDAVLFVLDKGLLKLTTT